MARKDTPFIPTQASELTTGWFTDVLHERFDTPVTEVTSEVIGAGVGFVGELHRCHLQWASDKAGLPPSVIVKIPATNAQNRALAEALAAYEREIEIYTKLGPELGLPMPDLYHASLDPHPAPWIDKLALFLLEKLPLRAINWTIDRLLSFSSKSTRRYVLVIEDIVDARPPAQADGGSLADAADALRVLARSHAATWMRTDLADKSDFIWSLGRAPKIIMASYLRYRDAFFARVASDYPPDVFTRLDRIQDNYAAHIDGLGSEPTVLLHGDYRLDNVLFRPDGELVVVDYQAVGIGRPGWDVGYFITTALSPDHRAQEAELLAVYHGELLRLGITGYDMAELVADVRLTGDVLAHRMVCGGDLLDTDRGAGEDSLVDLVIPRVLGWTMPLEQ
jgi:hypothetical protein